MFPDVIGGSERILKGNEPDESGFMKKSVTQVPVLDGFNSFKLAVTELKGQNLKVETVGTKLFK